MLKCQKYLVGILITLMLISVLPSVLAPSPRMFVDTYPSSGSGDIVDEAMRPGQIPISGASVVKSYPNGNASGYGWIKSYPSANTYNGSWVNPSNAYDKNDLTSADSDIGGPFKVFNSYASSDATNGTVTNPGYAHDKNQNTGANYAISGNPNPPQITYFDVQTFNNSISLTYPIRININMNYSARIHIYNVTENKPYSEFRILCYVGLKYSTLLPWTFFNKTVGIDTWRNVPEPNDGVWSLTDLGNVRIRVETRKEVTGGTAEQYGWVMEYEAWVTGGEVGSSYFQVTSFNATGTYSIVNVDFKLRYEVTLANQSEYRILYYVGSAYGVLSDWSLSSFPTPPNPVVDVYWYSQPEPNDGVWNMADIGNIKVRVETRKEAATGSGTFKLYEVMARFTATPYTGVINPHQAWDRNNSTYAQISAGGSPYPGFSYFEVKDFNATIPTAYYVTQIDVHVYWGVPSSFSYAQYRIVIYVGSKYAELITWRSSLSSTNLKTYANVPEPNDGVWNWTDIRNARVRVETQKTGSTGTGNFRLCEAWLSLPINRLVIGVSVENVVDLYTYQFYMNWSGPVFDVKAVASGPFLQQGGSVDWISKMYNDPTGNYTSVSSTLKAPATRGVDGNGMLAYVEFLVQAYGKTEIHLYNTLLKDSFGGSITHSTTDGYFDNRIPGDIDTNKAVNTVDLQLLAAAYGTSNPDADINRNNLVDVRDLHILGKNYGKTA